MKTTMKFMEQKNKETMDGTGLGWKVKTIESMMIVESEFVMVCGN